VGNPIKGTIAPSDATWPYAAADRRNRLPVPARSGFLAFRSSMVLNHHHHHTF
jgi:hypothetical protein